ncbi:MAG TPA: type II secretion system F family protein [Candidatus Rifleibacterium sp.]|nr:type II secretion system F family protein [Candidatus Rifleibacterium sp.]HPT47490.1 type II secretion system F family protein [Candidatus Rifleibacterium sp.]
MQLIFVGFVGVATLLFVLLLFSILGKPPGEEVRHRMEQYLVETEMAAEQYKTPEDEEEKPVEEVNDDDWVKENRAAGGGAKKILANMGTIITPKGMAIRIADQLAKADIPLKANEFVAIQFLAIMISLIVGMGVFKNLLVGIGLAFAGYFVPLLWVSIAKKQRVQAFNDQILDTLIMLANGLKAGYSFLQSLEMVSRETAAPMGKELKRVLKENSLGINLEETLMALNMRVESEDWDLVTTVVLIQRQVGGNLAEILEKIGFTIRQRMKIKGDIQTKTAQAKISGLLVGALPILLGLAIFAINPGFIMKLFTFQHGWFRGWFVVVAGALWECMGMYIIMQIVDIEV